MQRYAAADKEKVHEKELKFVPLIECCSTAICFYFFLYIIYNRIRSVGVAGALLSIVALSSLFLTLLFSRF